MSMSADSAVPPNLASDAPAVAPLAPTTAPNKKAKIKHVLKSAARLPKVPYLTTRRGAARDVFSPRPGELPLVVLRVQIIGCMGLAVRDKSGTSDPFVSVAVLKNRQQTNVAKRTLNPTYAPKDATFDFPLYLSLADKLGVVEIIVWDKDMLSKDYLGEVAFPLEDWFVDRASSLERPYSFDDPNNKPISLKLTSTRTEADIGGSIQLKLGFVPAANAQNLMEFDEIYADLVKRSRPSLVSAPPTEGVGTIRSHRPSVDNVNHSQPPHHQPFTFEDDGGISSDPDLTEDEAEDTEGNESSTPNAPLQLQIDPNTKQPADSSAGPHRPPELNFGSPSTPTPGGNIPTPLAIPVEPTPKPTSAFLTPATPAKDTNAPATPTSAKFNPKRFVRKISGFGGGGSSSSTPPNQPDASLSDREDNALNKDQTTTVTSTTTSGTTPPSEKKSKIPFRKPRWGGSSGSASVPNTPTSTLAPSLPSTPEITAASASGTLLTPDSASLAPGGAAAAHHPSAKPAKAVGRKRRRKVDYALGGANDIVGIVMLEIQGAEDLPRLKNMTRLGWDMDPFVVISFSKKVFRTRVIRHSLTPTWDEKLLFHVRRYETSFKLHFSILDWDKLTANDLICEGSIDVKDLIDSAEQPDPITGLYGLKGENGANTGEEGAMKEYKLECKGGEGAIWEGKHKPVLTFRAKYQPYAAIRQHFWRTYLKQYDTDDTNTMSHLELTSMLDSLGSTLTSSTISSFFTRFGKKPHEEEITMDQAIIALEAELNRPESEKKRLKVDGDDDSESVVSTPLLNLSGPKGEHVQLEGLDFSGPPVVSIGSGPASPKLDGIAEGTEKVEGTDLPLKDVASGMSESEGEEDEEEETEYSSAASTPPKELVPPLVIPGSSSGTGASGTSSPGTTSDVPGTTQADAKPKKKRKMRFKRTGKSSKQPKPAKEGSDSSGNGSNSEPAHAHERVINVKNCPLCHRPRLNSKAEVDIITHLAVCASQDWNKVDRIVVGNFVTASQAQRKWYTKVISKLSSGDYKLGANSANIIVQNRLTGQLEEEKMAVYVRLGIRLLYKGASSRMEGGRARKLLKSLSIKQGVKYDDPQSAADIPGFIAFHNLAVDEILDPLDSFKTFNEFFYRKLKPSARPTDEPTNPYRVVSAADCRLMTFESVTSATRLWIKGREFTVERLLGDRYKGEASSRYKDGALVIFRLAPQDYHRFHSPVEGTIGPIDYIAGEYYTVNPQAIRSALDVYGENARKIVPIDSPHFGRVMAVCIGAMMVGTINITVNEGDYVQRGQEFGYFAFGGSTIVMLFEKGRVEWDEDLAINGNAALETLVRVGMGIGRGTPETLEA